MICSVSAVFLETRFIPNPPPSLVSRQGVSEAAASSSQPTQISVRQQLKVNEDNQENPSPGKSSLTPIRGSGESSDNCLDVKRRCDALSNCRRSRHNFRRACNGSRAQCTLQKLVHTCTLSTDYSKITSIKWTVLRLIVDESNLFWESQSKTCHVFCQAFPSLNTVALPDFKKTSSFIPSSMLTFVILSSIRFLERSL